MKWQGYPEMKDSGIEWLGEIPEHWGIKRLKFSSNILNGYAFESNTYIDIGIPIIRIGDVGRSINWDDIKRVPEYLFEKLSRFKIEKGDILLALTGATIGKSSVFETDQLALLNQRVGVLRGTGLEQGFLKYFVISDCFARVIEYLCYGGAQENIGKEEVGNIYSTIPPNTKQKTIASFLDRKTKHIDNIIDKVKNSISLLSEYRTTLISAAVTGKIDVRKEAA